MSSLPNPSPRPSDAPQPRDTIDFRFINVSPLIDFINTSEALALYLIPERPPVVETLIKYKKLHQNVPNEVTISAGCSPVLTKSDTAKLSAFFANTQDLDALLSPPNEDNKRMAVLNYVHGDRQFKVRIKFKREQFSLRISPCDEGRVKTEHESPPPLRVVIPEIIEEDNRKTPKQDDTKTREEEIVTV